MDLDVYDEANPTGPRLARLETRGPVRFMLPLEGGGNAEFALPHTAPEATTANLKAGNVVRVVIDGVDRAAFRITDPKSQQMGESANEIRVSCDPVKNMLRWAAIFPECGLGAFVDDTRWFGAMSGAYNDAGWTAPIQSYGTFASNPFGDFRPDGWSDRNAEFITPVVGTNQPEGDVYFRSTLTVPSNMNVWFEVTADDEFDLFLCSARILYSRGAYQWDRTFAKGIWLPAGSYPILLKVHNLERPGQESTNRVWGMFSAMRGRGLEGAAGTQAVQQVSIVADGGTFTLTHDGQTTAAINWNAAASTVEAALDAITTGVAVTGTGTPDDPYNVTWDAIGVRSALTGDASALTHSDPNITPAVNVTVIQAGSDPDVLLRSNTTSWKMLAFPPTAPGLTPGEILRICVQEEQGRNRLAPVTLGFTDAADTATKAWPERFELGFPLGTDLLHLCDKLEDLNVTTEMTSALRLDAYHDRGVDRSATVQLTGDYVKVERPELSDEAVTQLLVRTDVAWYTFTDPAADTLGRKIDFVSLGGVTSRLVAYTIARELFAKYAKAKRRATNTWPHGKGPLPIRDMNLGDRITGLGWNRAQEVGRILSIAFKEDETGGKWSVELEV